MTRPGSLALTTLARTRMAHLSKPTYPALTLFQSQKTQVPTRISVSSGSKCISLMAPLPPPLTLLDRDAGRFQQGQRLQQARPDGGIRWIDHQAGKAQIVRRPDALGQRQGSTLGLVPVRCPSDTNSTIMRIVEPTSCAAAAMPSITA